MEQIKILEIINRWGYLDAYQIALLLNKDIETVKTHCKIHKTKTISFDKSSNKKKYLLSFKFGKTLFRKRKQQIKTKFKPTSSPRLND